MQVRLVGKCQKWLDTSFSSVETEDGKPNFKSHPQKISVAVDRKGCSERVLKIF
jgi:hypothetical protein